MSDLCYNHDFVITNMKDGFIDIKFCGDINAVKNVTILMC